MENTGILKFSRLPLSDPTGSYDILKGTSNGLSFENPTMVTRSGDFTNNHNYSILGPTVVYTERFVSSSIIDNIKENYTDESNYEFGANGKGGYHVSGSEESDSTLKFENIKKVYFSAGAHRGVDIQQDARVNMDGYFELGFKLF